MRSKILAFILFIFASSAMAQVTKPKDFFGFSPGEDKMLFTYEKLVDYLKIVEKQSHRVKMFRIGTSMLGRPIYMVVVSSEKNIENLDRLKNINRELAINPDLTQEQLNNYIKEGKVFVLMTLSMHSTEVGPSQALPQIVWHLATTEDPNMLSTLDNVVYMAVVNHNPDGMDMVVEHYYKYKGTKYEGSWLPGVYHKYVGHDDNRDFVTLTQSETRAINNLYNKDWFPQVMVEKHQMGLTGPRYFVPPKHDPIAQNIDAELWNWDGVFGLNMLKDMTEQGQKGVTFNYIFDDYWPGSTETAHWKNIIAMLTEAASARLASPVYVEPNELQVSGKGLAEYAKSVNMPDPWPGGWWRLSDIVRYEQTSTYSVLHTASLHHDELLALRNRLCRKEVRKGKTQPPYYYVIPQKQHDKSEFVRLVKLLQMHGIKVYKAKMSMLSDKYWIEEGDIVIPLSQPFRPFIKEVMEKQTFPIRHYTKGGPMIRPYDITSWSLPLHRGVTANEIDIKIPSLDDNLQLITDTFAIKTGDIPDDYTFAIFRAEDNDSYKAAFRAMSLGIKVFRLKKATEINGKTFSEGSFVIAKTSSMTDIVKVLDIDPVYINNKPDLDPMETVTTPKIALVETYFHDMDAGWTRYIFDNYFVNYTILRPSDFEKTDLSKYDVIIFPDNSPDLLKYGKYKTSQGAYSPPFYPAEYTKGMGDKGFEKLLKYIDQGGKVIAWGESSKLFEGPLKWNKQEQYSLPFTDISGNLNKKGLYVAGALVKLKLQKSPLTLGLPGSIGVFYRGRPVFKTRIPEYDTDRRVWAVFAKENTLMSGYAEHTELLAGQSAIVWLKKNKGQLILMAFNPQFRGSTQGSFKLLFNGILL